MQEQMAVIVEYILAMVACVYQTGHFPLSVKAIYHIGYHVGREQYRIVVGVYLFVAVMVGGHGRTVGTEHGFRLGIAVYVVEVRSIAVKHYELFCFPVRYGLIEIWQQVGVIVMFLVQSLLFDEYACVGLFAEKVYE